MSGRAQGARQPAAFLDRDGVLNVDHGYVYRIEDFAWLPGAIEAVKWLNERGYYVFVVSNQGGVALGRYSEDDVARLFAHMRRQLASHGARLDDVRYCPEHPQATIARYRQVSDWRKPGPGMIEEALARFRVLPAEAPVIGDALSDLQAAAAAGCPRLLVRTGKGAATQAAGIPGAVLPVAVYDDLAAAVTALLGGRG